MSFFCWLDLTTTYLARLGIYQRRTLLLREWVRFGLLSVSNNLLYIDYFFTCLNLYSKCISQFHGPWKSRLIYLSSKPSSQVSLMPKGVYRRSKLHSDLFSNDSAVFLSTVFFLSNKIITIMVHLRILTTPVSRISEVIVFCSTKCYKYYPLISCLQACFLFRLVLSLLPD